MPGLFAWKRVGSLQDRSVMDIDIDELVRKTLEWVKAQEPNKTIIVSTPKQTMVRIGVCNYSCSNCGAKIFAVMEPRFCPACRGGTTK